MHTALREWEHAKTGNEGDRVVLNASVSGKVKGTKTSLLELLNHMVV